MFDPLRRKALINANNGQRCKTRAFHTILAFHSGQTHDVCAVTAITLQKKTQTNVESFTLTAKLNAISENLSFLLRACVQNEVTGIHKFYWREMLFIGTFYVSFSYELPARESLN